MVYTPLSYIQHYVIVISRSVLGYDVLFCFVLCCFVAWRGVELPLCVAVLLCFVCGVSVL